MCKQSLLVCCWVSVVVVVICLFVCCWFLLLLLFFVVVCCEWICRCPVYDHIRRHHGHSVVSKYIEFGHESRELCIDIKAGAGIWYLIK